QGLFPLLIQLGLLGRRRPVHEARQRRASKGGRQKEHLISCCDRRQWRRASIRVPKLYTRRGKLARRRHTNAAREGADMGLWIMRRLQSLACQALAPARAATATRAGSAGTSINDRRDNVLRMRKPAHALNGGGAIVGKG